MSIHVEETLAILTDKVIELALKEEEEDTFEPFTIQLRYWMDEKATKDENGRYVKKCHISKYKIKRRDITYKKVEDIILENSPLTLRFHNSTQDRAHIMSHASQKVLYRVKDKDLNA